ncbi:MAG: tail fiber domain-containing protein [Bacteroidota bacterium]
MKKLIVIVIFLVATLGFSQTPQAFKYQAVARDNSGNVIVNQNIAFRITLLSGSPSGTSVFSETHTVASNDIGLVNFDIGAGNVISGSFSGINWGNSTYFIKIEMDVNGGSNYLFMGTSQLLSVPYALFADKANSVINDQVNDADANPNNEIQSLSISGNTLSISGSNSVTLPSGPTGPTGAIGATGPTGATGATGPSGSSGGGTLDQSYDFGGPGAGRTITTDAGSIQINNSGSNTIGLEVNTSVNSSTAVLATVSSTGVGFRSESTNPSNTFAAIQANTNSSSQQNSAILGNNSGGGYGISGQIPSNATGLAAVYGNNLRTSGGYGIYGQGFNGVVGTSNYPGGFGVYGSNSNTTGGTTTNLGIGIYGMGFNGIYGQTTNTTTGWAGYFTADLGCDGTGYSIGGWVTASDKRLKSNIVPIGSALNKISALEGKFYTITSKSLNKNGKVESKSRKQYGIIAQDLEKIFPEMISEKPIFINAGDITNYKTVEYTQLIPVLIEAIKELNNKVILLEEEIKQIKK